MPSIISIFNNKGGVGKTTFVYHLAYALESMGKRVLLVDGDPQCSLSIHFLSDSSLESSWRPEGTSIYRMVEPLLTGTGDIRARAPWRKAGRSIYMYPGDVLFGDYEEELSAAWVESLAGRERIQNNNRYLSHSTSLYSAHRNRFYFLRPWAKPWEFDTFNATIQ